MEPVGGLQEIKDAVHPVETLVARDEAALDANDKRHNAKPGSPAGHEISGSISFPRHAAVWLGEFPEVFEGLLLYLCQQILVADHRQLGGVIHGCIERQFVLRKRLTMRSLQRAVQGEPVPAQMFEG